MIGVNISRRLTSFLKNLIETESVIKFLVIFVVVVITETVIHRGVDLFKPLVLRGFGDFPLPILGYSGR